jgi:hypothetical protein
MITSNYIKGNVPAEKQSSTTFFWEEIFRDKFLNGIFLVKSYLPKSSLAG